MKTAFILLSLFFLGIWIAGFFIPAKGAAIHTALMISFLFYLRSVMTVKKPAAKPAK